MFDIEIRCTKLKPKFESNDEWVVLDIIQDFKSLNTKEKKYKYIIQSIDSNKILIIDKYELFNNFKKKKLV